MYATANLPLEVTVEVTGEDIAHGVPGDSESCPIALALNRTFGTNTANVDVDWYVMVRGVDRRIRAPLAAGVFALEFDLGRAVKPSTFRIRLKDRG